MEKAETKLDVHPAGTLLLTASLGRSVKLFDIRSLPTSWEPHTFVKQKEPECTQCLHEYVHPLSVNSAFFSQSGEMIVTTCQDNHLCVLSTVTTEEVEEHCVSIRHRNNTGKWLTKLMAEWYKPVGGAVKKEGVGAVDFFTCGSMDEPRQVNVGFGRGCDD